MLKENNAYFVLMEVMLSKENVERKMWSCLSCIKLVKALSSR